jgi:hypothetical protein
MEHPPYGLALVPYDFFLFGAMKQAFAWQHFDTIDDFLWVWRHFWEGFLRTFYRPFFKNA